MSIGLLSLAAVLGMLILSSPGVRAADAAMAAVVVPTPVATPSPTDPDATSSPTPSPHPESDRDTSGGPHSDRFGDSGDAAHGVGQPNAHRLADRHAFADADPHHGTHSLCASGNRNVHDLPDDPLHRGRCPARQRAPGLVVDAQPPSRGSPPRRVRDRRGGPRPGGARLDGGHGHGDDRQRISSGSRARRARGSGDGERPTGGRGGGFSHIDTRVLLGSCRGADPSRVGGRFVLSPVPSRHGGPDRRRGTYPTAGRRVGQATYPGRCSAPDAVHTTAADRRIRGSLSRAQCAARRLGLGSLARGALGTRCRSRPLSHREAVIRFPGAGHRRGVNSALPWSCS